MARKCEKEDRLSTSTSGEPGLLQLRVSITYLNGCFRAEGMSTESRLPEILIDSKELYQRKKYGLTLILKLDRSTFAMLLEVCKNDDDDDNMEFFFFLLSLKRL